MLVLLGHSSSSRFVCSAAWLQRACVSEAILSACGDISELLDVHSSSGGLHATCEAAFLQVQNQGLAVC
jgi:hypothetical protein